MLRIPSYNLSMIGTLFSSMNYGKSDPTGLSNINLMDYSLIRSGSYGKLMKAYYSDVVNQKKMGSDASVKRETDRNQALASGTSMAKDSVARTAEIQKSASAMTEASTAIMNTGNKSVFKGEAVTDQAYDGVKKFVDSYNSFVKAGGESSNKSITRVMDSVKNLTNGNSKALQSVGITVNEKDSSLTVDEKALKNADTAKLSALFTGTGSFGFQVGAKASTVNNYAASESRRSAIYSNYGNYSNNYAVGNLFNTTVSGY